MTPQPLRDVEVLAEGLAFPEGPVAMSDGSVVLVELAGGRVTRIGPDGAVDVVAELAGGPNGAAMGPDGRLWVCNNGGIGRNHVPGSIQRVDLASGAAETVYTDCDGTPLEAPNDLVFDADGGFWFTDHRHEGAILYAHADGSSIRRAVTRTASPNGIGLSPDGTVLYWAETHTRQVHRRRVVAPGELAPSPGYSVRALIFGGEVDEFALLAGLPGNHELDSLAVDSSGAVCVGTLVDAGVSEIAEDGTWTLHTLPDELGERAVTNVCFGGDDGTTLYATCALTGRLVRARWHRPGLALHFAV